MMDKLTIIASFSGLMTAVYLLAMSASPHKGWMRLIERICTGIVLCFLVQLMLLPFGIRAAQSPLAALSAGLWGLPGAALSTCVALWP